MVYGRAKARPLQNNHLIRGSLNSFCADYLICLRSLGSLDDVVFDFVTLLETLISFELDGAVVHENIGAVLATQKTVTFCIVKPLYRAFVLCHGSLLVVLVIVPSAWPEEQLRIGRISGLWGGLKYLVE